jgi:phage terminase large subunit GpA-like protein
MRSAVSPAKTAVSEALRRLAPAPTLSVSEWADAYRVLNGSTPAPGRWSTDRTPFLREIMDSLSLASDIERVIFMKSAQVGGTECLLNTCGYLMAVSPAATMLVQPTVEMAKRFSKQRLDPLIENSPALRDLVKDPRSRDSGNTILLKESRNGATLILTGANSAVGLRSLPARFLLADEIDGWPSDASNEGDPLELGIKRTAAFGSQRKILCISTPTLDGLSRIQSLYEASDQRRYFVPCPGCSHMQVLVWEQLTFDEASPLTKAFYRCEACGQLMANSEKTEMLAAGEWRATAAGDGRTAGFHLSALYSPVGWPSWGELARDYIEAKRSTPTAQVFHNTVLGLPWRDAETQPLDADVLYQTRREPYPSEIPLAACLLTAGVDVQDDRLELEIVAWGKDEECWSVSYSILYGDPSGPDLWRELDGLLTREYAHESGLKLTVQACCCDSGGHHSASVYDFAKARAMRKVWASKGYSGFHKPIFPRKASKGFNRTALYLLGVDAGKEKLYSRLRIEAAGPGYCHFPLAYTREYFEQLVRRTACGSL